MLREIKGGSSAYKLWVRILTSFFPALHTASPWGFFLCLNFVIYNKCVTISANFFPVSVRFCSAVQKTNEKPLSREKFLMSLYTGTLHSPWKAEENINYIGSKFHALFPVFPQHSSQCTQGSFWSEKRFRWAAAFRLPPFVLWDSEFEYTLLYIYQFSNGRFSKVSHFNIVTLLTSSVWRQY